MPLTKANSLVINVTDLSLSLKDATINNGIRDYIDDQITSNVGSLTTLINAKGNMNNSDNLSGLTDIPTALANLGIDIEALQQKTVFNGRLKAISNNDYCMMISA